MKTRQLKDVLKSVDILYITKKDNKCQKTLNTINIMFNKVLIAMSIEEASELLVKSRPSVIISEIDFPRKNGIEFLKDIRKTNKKIPIIILSDSKDEKYLFEAIKLRLIDYLLYPVDMSQFIKAINHTAKELLNEGHTEVKFNNNTKYNYITKTIMDMNNKSATLTKNEFRLLEFLIENKSRKVPKQEIEIHLWADEIITNSAFKSLFSRLRRKIGKGSIINTFGVGYNIECS